MRWFLHTLSGVLSTKLMPVHLPSNTHNNRYTIRVLIILAFKFNAAKIMNNSGLSKKKSRNLLMSPTIICIFALSITNISDINPYY